MLGVGAADHDVVARTPGQRDRGVPKAEAQPPGIGQGVLPALGLFDAGQDDLTGDDHCRARAVTRQLKFGDRSGEARRHGRGVDGNPRGLPEAASWITLTTLLPSTTTQIASSSDHVGRDTVRPSSAWAASPSTGPTHNDDAMSGASGRNVTTDAAS